MHFWVRSAHQAMDIDRKSDAWLQAKRYARELERVLEAPGRRGEAVDLAASALGLKRRQVYNLLSRYLPSRQISALLPRTGNPRKKRIDSAVEQIIEQTLKEKWMVLEAPDLAPVVAEIRARAEEQGLPPPAYDTVERRIPQLFTATEIAKARSANEEHVRRLKPRPGYIRAPRPLAICQMDHTPTDIQFVDIIDKLGVFVGRAYLTLLVDLFTRCILGCCVTLEKPKVLSVAICLAHAICPKDEWMKAHGLGDYPWPTFGRPGKILTDRGKDFRSDAFARGCDNFGIELGFRNRGRVHEGGVVERLLGKVNRIIGSEYGATGRTIADRDGYPSEKRACLTFEDLERCIALAIVEHNTQENKRTLQVPNKVWEANIDQVPRHNDDPWQVFFNFLPGEGRRLHQQGISMFAIDYYAEWLGPLVPERDRLGDLMVKFDPRDISRVYVCHPHTREFLPVGRRDKVTEPLTLWQHERDRRALRAANHRPAADKVKSRRHISAIAATAKQRHKAELRDAARAKRAAIAEKPYQTMAPAQVGQADAGESPPSPRPKLTVEDW